MSKRFQVGWLCMALVLGVWVYAHSQSYEVKQQRLEFALREFTGATHEAILQDATTVEHLYPRIVDRVIAEQGRREAAYVRALPSWSPLKQSWSGWQDFVDAYDPEREG